MAVSSDGSFDVRGAARGFNTAGDETGFIGSSIVEELPGREAFRNRGALNEA